MDIEEIKVGDILRYYNPRNGEQTIDLVTSDTSWLENKAFEVTTIAVLSEDGHNQAGNICLITLSNARFYSKDLSPEKLFEKKFREILDKHVKQ